MHRIDAPGATAQNLFTEGNPSQGIPATEVSDDWLNDVQEELLTVIEDAGITPVKGTQDQLKLAILSMIGGSGGNIKLDPLLDSTANQVITGLVFDKLVTKSAFMVIDIHRQTDSSNLQETVIGLATHDSADDNWRFSPILSSFDDSGTTFDITSTGQVRASTDALAGANYAAQLRVNGIIKLAL